MPHAENDYEALCDLMRARMLDNRIRAVLHRWYTFYERDEKDFDLQFELITDDFAITRPKESAMPSARGKHAYRDSLRGAPPGQEFSHWFESLQVARPEGAPARATITHRHQARGPARAGAALIRYDVELADDGSVLPRFSSLEESVVRMQNEPYQDAYAENRAAGFVFYWLSALERLAGDAAPLEQLLADGFAMHLSSGGTVDSRAGVAEWLAGQSAQAKLSAHRIRNLAVTPVGGGYHVSMEFLWEGVTRAGQPMTARTKHDWALLERGGRYPLLKTFRVRTLEPFKAVSAAEALAHS